MKLRNKKTGEIVVFGPGIVDLRLIGCNNVAEMIENGWEDYEEPKEHWIINSIGGIETTDRDEGDEPGRAMIEIGNYFETKEEAEKAVEKLKAWKRLKGHNLRVERGQRIFVNADNKLTSQKPLFVVDTYEEVEEDLDICFGGEE